MNDPPTLSLKDKLHAKFQRLCVNICLWGIGGGVALLILQAFLWLFFGNWPNIELATIMLPILAGTDLGAWLVEPQSWVGLHKIVRAAVDYPLWAWLIAGSFAGLWKAISLDGLPPDEPSAP